MTKPRLIPKFDLLSALDKPVRDIDEIPLTFGKYEGLTPCQILEEDPQYLIWAYEKFDARRKPCSKDLYELCLLNEMDEEGQNPELYF